MTVDPRLVEPMAKVDSAWLHMDSPTNRMMVVGVLVLDRPVKFAAIRRVVEDRLLRFSRFRQRVVDSRIGPRWELDLDFDLDFHLREVDLPAPSGQSELQEFVSELMSEPFDRDRPLWRMDFIPDYEGGSAVVCRIHHCIGDGIALTYVMLSMAEDSPVTPGEKPDGPDGKKDVEPMEALGRLLGRTVGGAAKAATELAAEPGKLSKAFGTVSSGTGAAAKLAFMQADEKTVYRGTLSEEKRAVWTRPIDLDLVKRIGRSTGATVNDVLTAAVSGALRRYLESRGEDIPRRLNLRTVVPVNLRPLEEAYKLGNRFGLVFLSLPLGDAEPLDRIFTVRRRMSTIKNSPEAFLAFQILRFIGSAPRSVMESVVKLFGKKASAVMTNVIGPRQPIFLAGAPMRQAMFWVPQSGGLGLGVSILSYNRQVYLGIATDAGLVPDPEVILQGFYDEFEALAALVDQVE